MVFKHIQTYQMEDIQSQGHLYQHDKTDAKVFFIENEDTNRAFTIGFKTPPYSDNGITHILEHSVLNGSQKFPTKEPFVELLKGSLSTYVNASTYPDKTIYPIASTNQQDYLNLMEVYLDAVFQPLMLENSQILAQEGWHYHLEDLDQDLIYKGVVYNEMKGALASPEYKISKLMTSQLYPDTPYQWESGGDPVAIPSLTQDEFTNYHKRYYHPSNSLTVIYGAIDTEATFQLLEEYFDKYDKNSETVDLSITPKIPSQPRIEDTYSLSEDDVADNKDFLALAWHVATPNETLDSFGLSVLSEILFGNPQAPLRKGLLDAGFAGDIDGGLNEIGYPRMFDVVAKYSDKQHMDQFITITTQILQDLVTNGIATDLITAALNKINFNLKEMVMSQSSPRGVIYATEIYDSWLYDGSPVAPLEFSKYLGKLEQLAQQGYFEKLIQEKFLNNQHRVEVILTAEPGKNDRLENEKMAQLQEYKQSLSDEEMQTLVSQTQSLIERQEAPDRPEDLAKIPVLKKEDLTVEEETIPLEIEEINANHVFYHAPQFTSGIDYVKVFFNVNDFALEDFTWLKLFTSILNKVDTENYSAADLRTQIDMYTGGISASINIYQDKAKQVKPYLVLSGKALEHSLSKMADLMYEILTQSKLDQTAEILKIVKKGIANFDQDINYSAHIIAANRACSQLSPAMKLSEQVSGIDYYNFLKDLRQSLQNGEATKVIIKLQDIYQRLMNNKRLSVLYIGEAKRGTIVKQTILDRFDQMPIQDLAAPVTYQAGQRQKEAFITAQDVNYVAQASLAQTERPYQGNDEVAATLLRYDYLWNNIRVKGGAYGAMYQVKADGSYVFVSYRDPNIAETLTTYQGATDFLDNLTMKQESFDKNIIGTMNRFEKPLSAYAKGMKIFNKYMFGYTMEEETQVKKEILSADLDDIKNHAKAYKNIFEDHSIVVIGNKAQIDKQKAHFDHVSELF